MAPFVLSLVLAVAAPVAGPGQGASGASGASAPGAGSFTEAVHDEGPGQRHLDWLAVPIAKYDTDAKFGYGGAAQLQGSGLVEPYRWQLSVQLMFTTAGIQSHFLRYDAPHFLGTDVRVLARLEYYREKFAPWYGVGNQTGDSLADHPELGGPHPFRYDEEIPMARLGASIPLGGALHLFAFSAFRDVTVRPYPGSLLAEQAPYGLHGGRELRFTAGLQHDTRDSEAVPTEGHLLELSLRGATRQLGSAYDFGGVDAKWLQFVPLTPALLAAFRLEGDLLSHGTPFYELNSFGGFELIDGLGGEYTARGIPQDRYVGQAKVLADAELRTQLASWRAFGGPLAFGTVCFIDLGRVWSPGEASRPGLQLHPGYGAGLRLWRRAFVLRADAASSPDRPLSLYFVFGQFF